jgi:uncharacterized repeat protein (TIGR01451 family)
MFDKLLSNLPYNPSLVHLMSFYARRLRREQSIRRLGLVFIAIAFLIQFVAVLSPAQPTLAQSNNDLINGGISSQSQAIAFCQNNSANYADILNNYGISCQDVANGTTLTLRSTDYNKQLFSMGRLPYGKAGETPANVNGKSYYWRYLWSWDSYSYSSYKAIQLKSHVSGKTYFILFNCGNLVAVGLPTPPPRCTWNSSLYATDSRCQPPRCALDKNLPADSPKCKSCAYDSKITKSNPRCVACPYSGYGTITKDNPRCKPPCPYNSSITSDNTQCKPCSASQTQDDKTACLELSKVVSNITQHTADANGTTALPADTLTYTLSAKNTGKATVKKFVVQEDMSDVLDYADIVSLNSGNLDNSSHVVAWPAEDIKPGQTASHMLTVRIKSPLPQTPISSSDPGHFDLTMTNVYGNTVNVKLPASGVKTTEQITQSLPNTGPGTGIAISFTIMLVGGYFFARTRLLAKETEIAIHQANEGVV